MDITTLNKALERQKRFGNQDKQMCTSCGIVLPFKLQDHHLHGEVNGEEKTPLCPNCHAFITHFQNMLPVADRSKSASQDGKDKMYFVTVGALLIELGTHITNYGFDGEVL